MITIIIRIVLFLMRKKERYLAKQANKIDETNYTYNNNTFKFIFIQINI